MERKSGQEQQSLLKPKTWNRTRWAWVAGISLLALVVL
jgi:hypothetical protein